MFLPILVVFAGYSVASWGHVLLKGYDIGFIQWVNPFSPYTWPESGDPATVPKGQVLPKGESIKLP
jgi:hypothetical protein